MNRKTEDRRLIRKYGITLVEREAMEAECGNKCEICGKPPGKNRLSVDHDHKIAKIKFKLERSIEEFSYSETYTITFSEKFDCVEFIGTKKDTREWVKRFLKHKSVRGLLCWRCNSGLQKYSDRPELFDNAAKYLRKFKEKNV